MVKSMKIVAALVILVGCGGSPFELAPQDSAPLVADTWPSCTVNGVAYPSCDGMPRDYGVRFVTDAGYVGICAHLSGAARVNCSPGDTCVVATSDAGVLTGTCL